MEQFEEKLFSHNELELLCTYWQKKLRIYDWTIGLAIGRKDSFDVEGRAGEIHITEANGSAKILILDPVDYPKNSYIKQDMEVTLVHELLHLRFFPDARNKQEELLGMLLMEQAIERTAQALVELRRNGKDKDVHKIEDDKKPVTPRKPRQPKAVVLEEEKSEPVVKRRIKK